MRVQTTFWRLRVDTIGANGRISRHSPAHEARVQGRLLGGRSLALPECECRPAVRTRARPGRHQGLRHRRDVVGPALRLPAEGSAVRRALGPAAFRFALVWLAHASHGCRRRRVACREGVFERLVDLVFVLLPRLRVGRLLRFLLARLRLCHGPRVACPAGWCRWFYGSEMPKYVTVISARAAPGRLRHSPLAGS